MFRVSSYWGIFRSLTGITAIERSDIGTKNRSVCWERSQSSLRWENDEHLVTIATVYIRAPGGEPRDSDISSGSYP